MDFREAIQKIVREQLPVQVFPGTVTELHRSAACFDAQPLDTAAPPLLDVRLRAVDDDQARGLIQWPAVGSVVLIGLIGNDLNTAFMVAASEVESFTISTAQESLLTVLQDLISEIKAMRFTTNQGPTIQLLNAPKFEQILQRLPSLLTA